MTLMTGPPTRSPLYPSNDPEIICCYVTDMLHRETFDAVTQARLPYQFVQISPATSGAYAAVFRQQWTGHRDLLWVEQDIIPPPDAFESMIKCDEPWCSYEYQCDVPIPAWGLGLCKFSAWMQEHLPTLGEQASRDYRGNVDAMDWRALNERIQSLAGHFGFRVHLHEPMAEHLHDYGSGNAGRT